MIKEMLLAYALGALTPIVLKAIATALRAWGSKQKELAAKTPEKDDDIAAELKDTVAKEVADALENVDTKFIKDAISDKKK